MGRLKISIIQDSSGLALLTLLLRVSQAVDKTRFLALQLGAGFVYSLCSPPFGGGLYFLPAVWPLFWHLQPMPQCLNAPETILRLSGRPTVLLQYMLSTAQKAS